MRAAELHAMSIPELQELAKKKGRRGNASSDAKQAQQELVRRRGGSPLGVEHPHPWFLSDEK